MSKKILILAANPRGDLRLDYEIKDLKDAIKRNEKFDVEIELAVNAESIDNLIAENQPLIVHFCGHGAGKQGLVVDKEGIEQSLSNEELANIFKSYGEGIECVLLNACYTEVQADVIAEYIPYVIGTSREILDKVAHYFSIGFYKGIAEEQPIETCYEWGYVSIKSNLENAEVVISIDEVNGKSRKLEVVNDGTVESTTEPLEIILKHNKFLESQFASNVSPQLEQEFIEEGRRKRYKDNLRNILNNFGQRIINRAKQIDDFELKQRETLIDKVQYFWIEGFLKPSLYFNTATDIDNDHPSGQILRPLDNLEVILFDIEQSYDSVKNSDIPDQISDGQTLLILGEPGSGKTIALLQLAARLVAESRENSKKPIPVVFNLSSWVEKQLPLEEWLIEELRDKYQVPKALSKPWIERQELTLLLDGLDEVKVEHRNACVKAIREFSTPHQATEMIVCSRIRDYEALKERLLLSSVICIQPLSRKQLLDFFENAKDSLSGLKAVIEQDSGIFQFATTPLILNMMTWTYHGWSIEQCYEQFRNPEYREINLFESYISHQLDRIDIEEKYPKNQVLTWLNWLAKQMVKESKVVFLIEKLQASLLNEEGRTRYINNNLLSWGLLLAIGLGLGSGLCTMIIGGGLIEGLIFGLIFGLIEGLMIGLIFGLYSLIVGSWRRIQWTSLGLQIMKPIVLSEKTTWKWKEAKSNWISNLFLSMLSIIIFVLGRSMRSFESPSSELTWDLRLIERGYSELIGFIERPSFGPFAWLMRRLKEGLYAWTSFRPVGGLHDGQYEGPYVWLLGLLFWLSIWLILVLFEGFKNIEVTLKTYPNQGIWSSGKNAVKYGLSFLLVGGLLGGLLGWLFGGLSFGVGKLPGGLTIVLVGGLIGGLILGSIGGIKNGGLACIQHFNLRQILHQQGHISWNYARFLDYAKERLLMKKVGGGYIFYHRMLMEHFANMELEQ